MVLKRRWSFFATKENIHDFVVMMYFFFMLRNYPLLMATWKVAPALAAGCAAILKPSELASVYVHLWLRSSFFSSYVDFSIVCISSCYQSIPELVWS